MAQIVAKTFDATKRILRSVFLGSPNLFTTSDVNRQIEAFKYQLDQLDNKVGVLSDMSWSTTLVSASTYSLIPTFSYIEVKGCDFTNLLKNRTITVNVQVGVPLYICIYGQTETITYSDDSTHEIAGAKFEDGTSRPAANQIRYKPSTVQFFTTTDPESSPNIIAILAVVSKSAENSRLTIKKNTVNKKASALLRSSEQVEYLQQDSTAISIGDTFNQVTNKFNTLLNNLKSKFFTYNSKAWNALESDTEYAQGIPQSLIRVIDSNLIIKIPSTTLSKDNCKHGAFSMVLPMGFLPQDLASRFVSADYLNNTYNVYNPNYETGAAKYYYSVLRGLKSFTIKNSEDELRNVQVALLMEARKSQDSQEITPTGRVLVAVYLLTLSGALAQFTNGTTDTTFILGNEIFTFSLIGLANLE